MNSQERTLISQLFERLRSSAGAPRDPEAEAFIRSQIAAQPHAPYAMAQTIIVQNRAIEAARDRIQELERQLRGEIPGGRSPAGFGAGGYDDERPMGAPDLGRGQGGGPWTHQRQQPQGGPWQQPQPAQAGGGGGGFLAGAAQTAMGVAGGALIFDAVRGMFGGGGSAAKPEQHAAADTGNDGKADTVSDNDADGGEGGGWFSDLFGGDDVGDGGDDWA